MIEAVLSFVPPPSISQHVELFTCEADGKYSVGSITNLGSAKVTAAHVLTACDNPPKAQVYASNDIAIITRGTVNKCKNAAVGEPVLFVGHPVSGPSPIRATVDAGVVTQIEKSVVSQQKNGAESSFEGMSIATAYSATEGFSGGAVLSAIDHRIVGVISSQAGGGAWVIYTPIESICLRIANLNGE